MQGHDKLSSCKKMQYLGSAVKQGTSVFLKQTILTRFKIGKGKAFFQGRKAMTNLDSILKSKDITLLTKVHIVKYMVLPVVKYICENWTINKADW